tara:strand:+ start:4951 stop:7107 length:2157 start_codon:yes stop_codon:yes gene_type:complete
MAIKIEGSKKNHSRPLSGDLRADFESFLLDHGMTPDPKRGLVIGGDIGRAYMQIDGKQKLVGWYQCWLDQEVPFGRCGDRTVSNDEPIAKWRAENDGKHQMTDAQRAEMARLSEQARKDREKRQKKAAEMAKKLWDSYEPASESNAYLVRKGVENHGLRETKDGRLVLPVLDADLKIVGLQLIDGDGAKKFLSGTKKKGSFFVIDPDNMRTTHTINYVEGYATGASYFADLGQPVVVCFDAFNLSPVAKTISGYFPKARHVFIADFDDSKTGEREAIKAAQLVKSKGSQAEVFMPQSKGDYNDHAIEGELMPELNSVDVPVDYDWNKTEKGRFLNTKENVRGVLTINQIDVRYNVIKKNMEISVPNVDFIADMRDESALIEIEDRCIQIGVPHQKVRDYLKLLAREYNPVKEWMESKPWDGTTRLKMFLDTITSSNEPLKEMLMTKWLVSCVAAVCEPNGVALEGILVFQGAQGLGKTLWFKRLADYENGWLLEGATLNPSDKDSVKQAVSHWIVELGEIESTFKKSDIDQLKAFVTKKSDELRLPYDRASTTYQRRTAFYASVNAREFLTDTSGNRRFWVVPVTDINANHGLDMQQVWAEIKESLYPQIDWFLNPDEREMLQDSNEYYRTQSSVEDLILEHVHFHSTNTKPVQMTKLLRDLGISQPRMPDIKDAARVFANNGVEPRKSNGKKVYDLDYTPVEVGNADKFVGNWGNEF